MSEGTSIHERRIRNVPCTVCGSVQPLTLPNGLSRRGKDEEDGQAQRAPGQRYRDCIRVCMLKALGMAHRAVGCVSKARDTTRPRLVRKTGWRRTNGREATREEQRTASGARRKIYTTWWRLGRLFYRNRVLRQQRWRFAKRVRISRGHSGHNQRCLLWYFHSSRPFYRWLPCTCEDGTGLSTSRRYRNNDRRPASAAGSGGAPIRCRHHRRPSPCPVASI